MSRPRTASLRHRVTIRKTTPTTDAYGHRTDVWTEIETVYAKVDPVSGTEWMRADKTTAEVSHRITMRWRKDLGEPNGEVLPKYQLQYDGRDFEIIRVVDVEERHRWLDILANEVL